MRVRKPKMCPIAGCCRPVGRMRMMCWEHWSALPMTVQASIRAVWRKQGRHKADPLLRGAINLLGRREATLGKEGE